jgi:hypothetical protein
VATREIRCAGCGSLLAKLAAGTLHLQRGELQASFDGDFRVDRLLPGPLPAVERRSRPRGPRQSNRSTQST